MTVKLTAPELISLDGPGWTELARQQGWPRQYLADLDRLFGLWFRETDRDELLSLTDRVAAGDLKADDIATRFQSTSRMTRLDRLIAQAGYTETETAAIAWCYAVGYARRWQETNLEFSRKYPRANRPPND